MGHFKHGRKNTEPTDLGSVKTSKPDVCETATGDRVSCSSYATLQEDETLSIIIEEWRQANKATRLGFWLGFQHPYASPFSPIPSSSLLFRHHQLQHQKTFQNPDAKSVTDLVPTLSGQCSCFSSSKARLKAFTMHFKIVE
jgi:hypothetical protein